ncbi:serine/threonine-protein kinase [Nocardia goodfellowii]|uniref:non-specific serine/threonine protein kinase n=1 Tax=Nocardia goodfellowii TaxID=882446 RepID=A0ABS4QC15_9NOCA|nr:serine/threonine-protein kinase [Nocardia goodfellowii]MBP2189240.1 serine/threonine protein kinase [Nocardia goodfellowii]
MISGRTMVDGRFELIEPLGSGGMGTVWRALDVMLHREVALKEVRPDVSPGASSPDVQRERVLREARALARIGHPNVVAVHHIVNSAAEAHPWIVMELVRGQSLADRLAAGPLPVGVAARLGRGILAGLRAAHAVGVLHRDVKPANVMLREDDSPVLTDFGIAAIDGLNGLTSTGHLVGSLEYVAPERLGGQEGHPASDLWSLGLVLYVAVEGFHPMRRETTVAVLAAVLAGEVPPPRRAGPLTPVLAALLVADPERRPSLEQVDQLLAQAISATSTPSMRLDAIPQPFPGPESTTRSSVDRSGPPSLPGARYAPAQPVDAQQLSHAPRPPERRRNVLIVGGIAALLIASATVPIAMWTAWPDTSTAQPSAPGTPSATPGPATDTETAAPAPTESTSLLTPDGIRQAIASIEKATGSTEFTDTVIYPDFINTGVPVPNRPTVYDSYNFKRENSVTTRIGPGGTLTDPTIRLNTINWDLVPGLFRTAEEKIGLPNPTKRYIIVDHWSFNDDKPTLRFYLADDYDGGYLAAALDGTVVHVVPVER